MGEVFVRARLIPLLVLLLIGGGAALVLRTSRPTAIERKQDVLEQYFHARTTWLEPGFRQRGNERQRLLRDAVRGMQAVIDGFPSDDAAVTRALAEYDIGLCYRTLGETDRAREAFLRVRDYKRFSSSGMHPSGRDALDALLEAARERLRELNARS